MDDLENRVRALQDAAEKASLQDRPKLRPQIDRVIATLSAEGRTVPARLRWLSASMKDEAEDDIFDNMPV